MEQWPNGSPQERTHGRKAAAGCQLPALGFRHSGFSSERPTVRDFGYLPSPLFWEQIPHFTQVAGVGWRQIPLSIGLIRRFLSGLDLQARFAFHCAFSFHIVILSGRQEYRAMALQGPDTQLQLCAAKR